MSATLDPHVGPRPVHRAPASVIGIAMALWAVYTVVQTLLVLGRLGELPAAGAGLALGLAGLAVLLAAGFSPAACYLRPARLSWRGALALGWLMLLWPFVLATGEWVGWDAGRAAVQAAGGLAQEVFFRSVLLPVLLVVLRGRWALLLHAVLFTVWHAGALLVTPPGMIGGAVAILVVAFLAGLSWGWQTMHDGTVWWAVVHHALLWVVGSMFSLAPPT